MQTGSGTKAIHLTPSWKQYLPGYVAGLLTIPLLGVGFYLLYRTRRRQQCSRYRITDDRISSEDVKYHQTVDLENIEEVKLRRSLFQKWLGIADVVLKTSRSDMILKGMEDYERLQSTITKAAAALRKSREDDRREVREPEYDPGSMERMDYLTGLWQQGLLSDSDFKKQRKNYE